MKTLENSPENARKLAKKEAAAAFSNPGQESVLFAMILGREKKKINNKHSVGNMDRSIMTSHNT